MSRASAAIAVLLLAGAAFAQPPGFDETKYSCVVCHSDVKVDLFESSHAGQDLLCHDCHGGNPSSFDRRGSMEGAPGFRTLRDKREALRVCSSCHSDFERMRHSSLPTDQMEHYRYSVHGEALLTRGDQNAAACPDCHTPHRVLPGSDPASSTYPVNVPATCAKCHADSSLMSRYGISSDVPSVFASSYHGRLLIEGKDRSAPSCASCHGNHGAAPPGYSHVAQVCGGCHITTRTYFLESEHADASRAGRMRECDSCHGHHDVARADVSMFDTTCAKCHTDPESGPRVRGREIAANLSRADQALAEGDALIAEGVGEGVDLEVERGELGRARSDRIEVEPVTHSLRLDRVEGLTERIFATVATVRERIQDVHSERVTRRVFVFATWVFAVGMAAGLFLLRKRLMRGFVHPIYGVRIGDGGDDSRRTDG